MKVLFKTLLESTQRVKAKYKQYGVQLDLYAYLYKRIIHSIRVCFKIQQTGTKGQTYKEE